MFELIINDLYLPNDDVLRFFHYLYFDVAALYQDATLLELPTKIDLPSSITCKRVGSSKANAILALRHTVLIALSFVKSFHITVLWAFEPMKMCRRKSSEGPLKIYFTGNSSKIY